MAQVQAVVFFADGFEEVEGLTVVDILRRAKIETEMVSVMDKKEVVGAHRVTVICDGLFSEQKEVIENADILILPGGGGGTENLCNHEGVGEALKAFKAADKWLAAVCAAPKVLGKHGLLQDETAVCYPGCEDELRGARIGTEKVAVSNKIITSKGPGTTADFAFEIVSQLKGRNTAETLKKQMLY